MNIEAAQNITWEARNRSSVSFRKDRDRFNYRRFPLIISIKLFEKRSWFANMQQTIQRLKKYDIRTIYKL